MRTVWEVRTMRIIGIDPDTKSVTFVQLDTKNQEEWRNCLVRVEVKGRRAEDRVEKLWEGLDVFSTVWRLKHPDWVYIETPVMGVNAKALRDQAVVVGLIRSFLWRKKLPHSMVDNGTWKKAVLGNGHASKEEIAAYAQSVLGLEAGLAQDYYDAACIAQFGLHARS